MSLPKNKKGTKRICDDCNTRWYDLNKEPLVCPVCKKEVEISDINNFNFINSQNINKNQKSESDLKLKDLEEDTNEPEISDEGEEIISLEEAEDIEEKN